MTPEQGLATAMEALRYALAVDPFSSVGSVVRKTGRDVVTEADVNVEARVVGFLGRVAPDHAVLSEEKGGHSGRSEYTWVIDPIDGTVNFSRGFPLYAVSIALLRGEVPQCGVVHVPAMGRTYSAAVGGGAFCNGERIRCSDVADPGDALVSVMLTSHYDQRENDRALGMIGRANMRFRGVRILVCEAAELCMIAEGILDGNGCMKADAFGAMAGKVILEEAGGCVTDLQGGAFVTRSDSILASNGLLHAELARIFRGD